MKEKHGKYYMDIPKPLTPLQLSQRKVAGLERELSEAKSEITRHHKDFESISAVATLVRNGRMSAEEGMKMIQGVVG